MTSLAGKFQRNKSGFTLVELMTVLAIIGVLVVIALPEYNQFKARVFDAAALSDLAQFRNAVADDLTPASFSGFEAGPVTHSQFAEVKLSNGVRIFDVSFSWSGQYLFYVIGCHPSGSTGYLMVVPYGSLNPFSGWAPANEILESPGYRWVCP